VRRFATLLVALTAVLVLVGCPQAPKEEGPLYVPGSDVPHIILPSSETGGRRLVVPISPPVTPTRDPETN